MLAFLVSAISELLTAVVVLSLVLSMSTLKPTLAPVPAALAVPTKPAAFEKSFARIFIFEVILKPVFLTSDEVAPLMRLILTVPLTAAPEPLAEIVPA